MSHSITRWVNTWVIAGLLFVLATGDAPAQSTPPNSSAHATVESVLNLSIGDRETRRRYHDTRTKLANGAQIWMFTGILGLLLLRVGPRVWKRTKRLRWSLLRTAVVTCTMLGLIAIWMMPVSYISFTIERNWGFVHHSVITWLSDRGTDFLFELAIVPVVWVAFALLKRSPKHWWLWLWIASIPYQFVMIILWPVVVAPAYNKLNPMAASPLRSSILQLSERAGAKNPDIFVVDISKRTKRLNAYMAGLGPTKRIVYWDTTIKSLNNRQILAITGHELGHYVLGHVWWKWGEGAFGALIALWLLSKLMPWACCRFGPTLRIESISEPSSIGLWLLAVHLFLFAQSPIESAVSRFHEREADRFGIELTHDGLGAAQVFAEFVKHDFSDPDPPAWVVWWWYSHPPSAERIASALRQAPPLQQ